MSSPVPVARGLGYRVPATLYQDGEDFLLVVSYSFKREINSKTISYSTATVSETLVYRSDRSGSVLDPVPLLQTNKEIGHMMAIGLYRSKYSK